MSEAAGRQVLRQLRAAGFKAWFAGGAVRDLLLGRPASDFDVATDARPESVMALFPRHSAVGAAFGVVLVHVGEAGSPNGDTSIDRTIEVATFRTDGSYVDGRHPVEVAYSDNPRTDVERRDFTINGLLFDPFDGSVLDYVGGRADLQARLVRAISDPERRFREDRLRMLRAVRFAARLGFEIEPITLAAIRSQASEIVQISTERIRDEILKMLTEGSARRAFELLDETGLLEVVLPEVARMKGVQQPPQFHPEGDVWTHTLMMIEALPQGCSRSLALGTLLHDVGKPPTFRIAPDRIRFDNHASIGARVTDAICQRLRLSREESDRTIALVEGHMMFQDVTRMRESTLKRFLRQPDIEDRLTLHRLDCTMSHGNLDTYEFVRTRLSQSEPEDLSPPRLLTGNDLLHMGYTAGPRFREILDAVEDAQLDGRLRNHQEAETFVREHFSR